MFLKESPISNHGAGGTFMPQQRNCWFHDLSLALLALELHILIVFLVHFTTPRVGRRLARKTPASSLSWAEPMGKKEPALGSSDMIPRDMHMSPPSLHPLLNAPFSTRPPPSLHPPPHGNTAPVVFSVRVVDRGAAPAAVDDAGAPHGFWGSAAAGGLVTSQDVSPTRTPIWSRGMSIPMLGELIIDWDLFSHIWWRPCGSSLCVSWFSVQAKLRTTTPIRTRRGSRVLVAVASFVTSASLHLRWRGSRGRQHLRRTEDGWTMRYQRPVLVPILIYGP